MNVASPPVLRPEDFPEVDPKLLEAVTRALRAQADAIGAVPTSALVTGIVFSSDASGLATVSVKNPLSTKPLHVNVRVTRDDGSPMTTVWGVDSKMAGDSISLSFLNLPASVKLRLSLEAR